jgi:hypothetical protein
MFNTMDYGVYFLFSSVMLFSVPFVYFLIPETKAVPLEAMDRLFKIKPVRNAQRTIMSELLREEQEFHANIEEAGLTAIDTKTSDDRFEKA